LGCVDGFLEKSCEDENYAAKNRREEKKFPKLNELVQGPLNFFFFSRLAVEILIKF
jgi:hypothetical protein